MANTATHGVVDSPWALDWADQHKLSLPSAYDELQKHYQTLLRNYAVAVRQLTRQHGVQMDLQSLAAWTLRTSSSGWALIADGHVSLTNTAFDRLDTAVEGGRGWQYASKGLTETTAATVNHPSLRLAAIGEANLLQSSGEQTRSTRLVAGTLSVEMIVESMPPSSGRPTALATVRDVTDLAKAEAKIAEAQRELIEQQAHRALGELSLVVAHDLQNLLGALVYRIAALERNPALPDSEIPNLQAMSQIASSGNALVAKLRSFGQTLDAPRVAVDLIFILGRAVATAESEVAGKVREHRPVRVLTELPPLPQVLGRDEDLCNVFVNLLLNAHDAMPEGGTIHVGGRIDEHEVVLVVEDEGGGIEAENLPKIFDLFFSTKGSHGTGIGLAAAKETMTNIGGSIVARNREEGGACFELRFLIA